MTDPRAQRTLVKSPPELWAEVSDPGSLTRHLGEFGEIRITRLDPETTVAWEGDRVRGTVELQASGWGTKVTLTAQAAPEPESAVVEEVAEPVAATARAAAPLPQGGRRPSLLSLFRRRPRAAAPEPVPPPVLPPEPEPRPEPEPLPPAAAGPDDGAVEAVLVGVLDELGAATRRPFSR